MAPAAPPRVHYPAVNDFEILAYHYGEAGNLEKALNYLTKAGDRASQVFAYQEAEVYFLSALDLVEENLERADLLKKLGVVQGRMAQHEKSIHSWLEGVALFKKFAKVDEVADLYARCGRSSWESGETPGNLKYCLEGLNDVNDEAQGPGIAKLLAETARAYYFNNRLTEVEPFCRKAIQMAEKYNADNVLADALTTLALLPDTPVDEAVSFYEKAIQLTENQGYWNEAARAHNNLAVILAYRLGDIKGSIDHLHHAAELAHKVGDISKELFYRSSVTSWFCYMGDFERVEESLKKLNELYELLQDWQYAVYLFRMVEAALLKFRGELEESILLYKELQNATLSGEDPQAIAGAMNLLAEALIEAERLAEAKPLLEEAIPLGDSGALSGSVMPRMLLAFIHAKEGDFSIAHQRLEEAQQKYIEKGSRTFDELWLKTGQTRVAFLEKDWDEAWDAAEATQGLLEKLSFRWYRAYLLLEWGKACRERGQEEDLQQADRKLQEAASEFADMGITHYAKVAHELLKNTSIGTL